MTSAQPKRPGNGEPRRHDKPVLITGGAGFIGANLAYRLLSAGHEVILYDNLSRRGVEKNAAWLTRTFGSRVKLVVGDTRDREAVREAVRRASAVFHFAAQVAVTTSLSDPMQDFDVNLGATLHVLEALRELKDPPPLLYTSTNKVYGSLSDLELAEHPTRVVPRAEKVLRFGIDESRPLDFYSPYGCSKGAADQYVIDYARSFGIKSVVFRMSCIYGPRQFGTEDQGWVAHFLISALQDRPITLYGDGKQIRDLLFVEDLTEAMELAMENVEDISGQAFNMGGGPSNTLSLLELVELVASITGKRPAIEMAEPRLGDQRYYVSDTSRFSVATGWKPRTAFRTGLDALHRWLLVADKAGLIQAPAAPSASVNP